MAEPEPSIEDALVRLETIADRLEDPSLDLDEAMRLYEEGLRLYERCAKKLDAAELRITQLADALQKQARGYAVPDSFTHGTSAQRSRWFKAGFQSGDIKSCDTFSAQAL